MESVTYKELDESFKVNISWPKTIGYVKTFDITNGAGIKFSGRLYWGSNDGFTIYWDNEKAPEMAGRPDFASVLDSYMLDVWTTIPPYGDLSDAGMDGA